MNYGFVINNDDCIGCHACSTACKSENEVPIGVNRTWVKSVETGRYPDVTRSFQVTRCNHCANPPCVRICPVTAMYQRTDGIVEFDPDACIGCKACMQACPYDAIYIDPESGTAAKCHYCAHRVDVGLEPACVVVCPEHAIIAGDMDNPDSEISRVLAKNQVTVRKPEQGTAPKLAYIGGNDSSLQPTATSTGPSAFAWADVLEKDTTNPGGDGMKADMELPILKQPHSGTAIRGSQDQGLPLGGSIQIGQGRMADQMTQVVYNAQHKVPWHWQVPAYLVTKAIASGLFLFLAIGYLTGLFNVGGSMFAAAGLTTLVFMAATTLLLVFDLERPERFLRIILQPQWKSWLTRGAFILIGFSTLAGIWWLVELGGVLDRIAPDTVAAFRPWLLIPGCALAFGTAIYTAFLFGQAEGRDLWQSTLLPFHLALQALMVGTAAIFLLDLVVDTNAGLLSAAGIVFSVSLTLDLFVTVMGEFGMPHATDSAARAAHEISHGRYRNYYWFGSLVLGHGVPLLLIFLGLHWPAALCAIAGLYFYEYAFVMAPQTIPNS